MPIPVAGNGKADRFGNDWLTLLAAHCDSPGLASSSSSSGARAP